MKQLSSHRIISDCRCCRHLLIILTIIVGAVLPTTASAARKFKLHGNSAVAVNYSSDEAPIVKTAIEILTGDIAATLGGKVEPTANPTAARIVVGTIGVSQALQQSGADLSTLDETKEGFTLQVVGDGRLIIAGSDCHGTAYGIMELSRLLGVSPWEWWADAQPERKTKFELSAGFTRSASPSVEYRGIFINDEDWGMLPWSSLTFEPENGQGVIGCKTNAKIFELMLRLRANTFWPAMHECTRPFFMTDGNREAAEKYGIYIGGSHCEPMASSTAGEWPLRGHGKYDYVNNADAVRDFWSQRLREVAGQEIVYTLGMRGVHDSKMLGAKTVDEQRRVLETVIADQRELLTRFIGKEIDAIPQVFIPYKEVLDVYRSGLAVPDDVTLMWCDDNYGYIRNFPSETERKRRGGNGVYYHISYWGRPHDHLWLATFSPGLLVQQMSLAYDRGIRKMWILNVGDIKPAEYQIELFMDMAWDIDSVRRLGVENHLNQFLAREFGKESARRLLPTMLEHYRLAFIRKPEFMGNTRVEESDRKFHSTVRDLPWSETDIRRRLADYASLSDRVNAIESEIPPRLADAYYQLVQYPVMAAAQMNCKLLKAQLARHGKASWSESDTARDSIISLTAKYNRGISNHGKWNRIMDCQPRKLPVFDYVSHTSAPDSTPLPPEKQHLHLLTTDDAAENQGSTIDRLGHFDKSTRIDTGQEISFVIPHSDRDSLTLELHFIPTHPIEGRKLRVVVSLDSVSSTPIDFATKGRSEEWKLNVLGNNAVRRITLPLAPTHSSSAHPHRIAIRSLSDGIIFDHLYIY